jgi:endonuclease/exonuclease/phosphatase family metal-dependent hydrolase
MKKLLLICLACILKTSLILAQVVPAALAYEMPAQEMQSETSIRFFSFNIRVDHEQDRDTENQWEFRAEKALFVVQKYLGGIIALQEPNLKQLEDIKAALGPNYTWIYGKASDRAYEDNDSFKSEQHRETQAIGFDHNRFELVDSGRFWLAENPYAEPIIPAWDGSPYARVVVYTLLEERETGKKLGVFTAHFDHLGVEARINSVKLIVEKAIELSKGAPFIISGDMNTFPNNGGPLVYEAFENQFNIITDVRNATANQYGPVSTWVGWDYNAFNEKIVQQTLPGIPSRFDHIFISKTGIEVECTAVCDDQFEIDWNGAKKVVYPSDHRPMFMDFRFH